MTKILDAVSIPHRMALLPRDRRGYPIPWIVQRDLTGRAFFTMNDAERVVVSGKRKVCGICGQKLGRDIWLVGGPGSALHKHGAYLDPPMHKACAVYALKVCPYLASRYTGRIDQALLKHGKWPPHMRVIVEEAMLPQQPPFMVLARTDKVSFTSTEPGGVRFIPKRPWLDVEFWVLGQRITEPDARERLITSNWSFNPDELAYWPEPIA